MREKLILLSHCRRVGWKSILKLLQYDSSLSFLREASPALLQTILQLPSSSTEIVYKDLQTIPIQDILKKYSAQNIRCITITDPEYPALLKNIYDPPWVLYTKGDYRLLNNKSVSIVGTRTPTSYGIKATKALCKPLVEEGWTIVSGLAKGVDALAHKEAILHGGKTVAVLGSGFYNIYPKENCYLASDIANNHLLLSEYNPFIKPHRAHFPLRNRIISGLSFGTIVIQAKERSGSFITADQALSQGREVFAVPGSIFEECSKGTNKLIQLGAKLVCSAKDVTSEIHFQVKNEQEV
ncbi:DNA-processing protein DprA [Priestia endophytica]|uniref:DNA-processing protein DprA n=1 Tax=Priestia endophytica TaxID=135735 RepID=UPI00227F5FF6|nr:DNA-processing protein DprA [Priestia endophytica]MCY8231868.1 DNA-processing protein DprA [Priestia endophytica]